MAIISNVRNDGNPAVTTGPKKVNSLNVYPLNFVATASPGTPLTGNFTANYDFFNVAQTSAATDLIVFSEVLAPNGQSVLPVGTVLYLYCVSACKVIGAGTNTFNGGTTVQGITMAAGSLYEYVKTTATAWIVGAYSAAGAFTAPVAA